MSPRFGGSPWVVCAATADWDAPLWTNKQHLMSRLAARGTYVLYMDSPGHRAPTLSGQDAGRMWRRARAWRPHARLVADHVLRDSPLVIPLHRHAAIRSANAALLTARLRRNRAHLGIDRAVLWAYTPSAIRLHDPTWHSALVYHCVDDLSAYPGISARSIAEDEAELIRRADVCLASSRPLFDRLMSMAARAVEYWPNPAATEAYSSARRPNRHGERPVIGFIGAIQEHKVDTGLITQCALALPECWIDMVGPLGLGLGSSAIDPGDFPSNVRFTGAVPKEALPKIVASFDVGIIPYRLNDYTRHVFPMKVFEYLAAGLPVVSTPLPSLVGEVEHIDYASSAAQFVDAIRSGIDSRADERASDRRADYAADHSWERRADTALSLLQKLDRHFIDRTKVPQDAVTSSRVPAA